MNKTKQINRFAMKRVYFLLILVLAFILRFWGLGDYPALNADEAAIGYNAYSLVQTGKDEHGNPWPIHFQSFNDYKPGLYFYLVLPFVKFLGLNEWAVRIPGAFFGVATVFITYLLVKELFAYEVQVEGLKKLTRNAQMHYRQTGELFALISALFLAVSPWHLHFSRGGWEVNVATCFIALGVWLFVKANKEAFSIKFLVLSVLSFIASFYTYHAARIVVPLLILGFIIIYREKVRRYFKEFIFVFALTLLFIFPLAADLAKGSVFSRAAGVGLFADTGPLARINEQRGEHANYTSLQAVVLHNKLVNYGLSFLENWADHFHGEFLFLSGDVIQRNKVPETGQMYIFDALLLVMGVCWLVKNIRKKGAQLFLLWLLIAPTAAALTFQSPHALRAQNMVIPLVIISASGLVGLVSWIRRLKVSRYGLDNKHLLVACNLLLGTVIAWNFLRYQHIYWVHMTKEYPFSSQYGIKELVGYLKDKQNEFDKVIVTDRYDQPYILFLFYLKYPPGQFQKEHELSPRDRFGFSTVRNFAKYEFREIEWDIDQPKNPKSLIIGTVEEIPDTANIVEEIYGSNGYKYFEVVAN